MMICNEIFRMIKDNGRLTSFEVFKIVEANLNKYVRDCNIEFCTEALVKKLCLRDDIPRTDIHFFIVFHGTDIAPSYIYCLDTDRMLSVTMSSNFDISSPTPPPYMYYFYCSQSLTPSLTPITTADAVNGFPHALQEYLNHLVLEVK